MNANVVILLLLLVLGLSFNGRERIQAGLARVPALVRSRRLSR